MSRVVETNQGGRHSRRLVRIDAVRRFGCSTYGEVPGRSRTANRKPATDYEPMAT